MATKAKCTCGDESKPFKSAEKAQEWARDHEQAHVNRKSMFVEWFAAAPPMSEANRKKIFEVIKSIE